MTYTRQQIESGEGRYTRGGTVFLQRGSEDVFISRPRESGWKINPASGYHIAGYCYSPDGPLEWVDVWSVQH